MSGLVGNWTFASRVNQDGKSGTGVFNLSWCAPGLVESGGVCGVCGDIGQLLRVDGRRGRLIRALLEWTAEGGCPYMDRADGRGLPLYVQGRSLRLRLGGAQGYGNGPRQVFTTGDIEEHRGDRVGGGT